MSNTFSVSTVAAPSFKVGDIVYYTWGYNCTRAVFARVVRATAKGFKLLTLDAVSTYEEGSEHASPGEPLTEPLIQAKPSNGCLRGKGHNWYHYKKPVPVNDD